MVKQQPLSVVASSSGGCAAKIGPGQLANILAGVDFGSAGAGELIRTREDVGVIALGTSFLVQSVDVIAPVTDDAYTYGSIAAAHALSDIFAKAAEPIGGLITLALPLTLISDTTAAAILQGVADKLAAAGAAVLGGHTVASRDLLVGVAVTGIAEHVLPNNSVEVGDYLVLTKPLGVGVVTTALRLSNSGEIIQSFSQAIQQESERLMLTLNGPVARELRYLPVHACTDVSGFGLIGHITEMAPRHRVVIDSKAVPVVLGARELVSEGIGSSGGERNWAEWADRCLFMSENARSLSTILFDPQTSGGLLIGLDPKSANHLLARIGELGLEASIIGEVQARAGVTTIEIS